MRCLLSWIPAWQRAGRCGRVWDSVGTEERVHNQLLQSDLKAGNACMHLPSADPAVAHLCASRFSALTENEKGHVGVGH